MPIRVASEATTPLRCLTQFFQLPGYLPSPPSFFTNSSSGQVCQKAFFFSLSQAFRQGLLGCNPQESGNFVIPAPPIATAWECPLAQEQPRYTNSTLGCGAGDKASLFHCWPPHGPTLSSPDLGGPRAAVATKRGFADEAAESLYPQS